MPALLLGAVALGFLVLGVVLLWPEKDPEEPPVLLRPERRITQLSDFPRLPRPRRGGREAATSRPRSA